MGGTRRGRGRVLSSAAQGLLGKKGGLAFSHPSSQERMNKKQKKAAPSEEDDSGVEVYYREGEEEIEEMSVLPKVRDSFGGGKAALGRGL